MSILVCLDTFSLFGIFFNDLSIYTKDPANRSRNKTRKQNCVVIYYLKMDTI